MQGEIHLEHYGFKIKLKGGNTMSFKNPDKLKKEKNKTKKVIKQTNTNPKKNTDKKKEDKK